ncbi:PH domain-containing protein [Flaviflexus equikiangi]|uniref:PH domain-containing protein n=1 Tax=Flaviflexus equikiangi TaxID=2758573 RepID=A0ABS2TGW5_9ACTO|nr:PH domain-containing protein [Flaviflexus equikiangi]MBM9433623.1 PH domain-containing protein [Flaviflexus equikiangi]
MTVATPLAPGITFTRISTDHAKVRALVGAFWFVPVAVLLIIAAVAWSSLLWLIISLAAVLVLILTVTAVKVRAVYYTGYHETDEELLVCRGIMFRRLDVVPYGRMQEVKVEDGPLLRGYGLASITMETASATADAKIPGVPRAEADRLRRRLTELGTTKMEGL